jgi:hypothetical protein
VRRWPPLTSVRPAHVAGTERVAEPSYIYDDDQPGRRVRWRLLCALVAVSILTACHDNRPSVSPTTSPTGGVPIAAASPAAEDNTEPTGLEQSTTSTQPRARAAVFESTTDWESFEADGELVVRECVWNWFDRYTLRMTWRPTADVAEPAEIGLSLRLPWARDDLIEVTAGVVTLGDSGEFDLSLHADQVPRVFGIERGLLSRNEIVGLASASCEVDIVGHPSQVIAPTSLVLAAGGVVVDGTLTELASEVDDLQNPMLVVAAVIHYWGALVPIDRLYLNPDLPVGIVTFDRRESCTQIDVLQNVGAEVDGQLPGVVIEHRHNCPSANIDTRRFVLEDGELNVSAYGVEVDDDATTAAAARHIVAWDTD